MKLSALAVSLLLTATASASPPITALALSPEGKSVVVGSQAGLEIRSWPALEKLRSLPTKLVHLHDLAFSPQGNRLLAVGGAPAQKGSIECYNWPEGTLLTRTDSAKDLLLAVCWRADSACFVTTCADGMVRTHSAATLKERQRFEGHSRGVLTAAYLPGREQLITAGLDESVRLWDAERGTLLRTLTQHTRPVLTLAVRPGKQRPPMLVTGGEDRTVRLWQPTIGRMVRFARLHSVPLAVVWTPEEKLLVACKDGRLRLLDPDTMEVQHEVRALEGVAYSLVVGPDGEYLVGGQNGQLKRVRLPKDSQ